MGTATDSECESLVLPHLADDEVFGMLNDRVDDLGEQVPDFRVDCVGHGT